MRHPVLEVYKAKDGYRWRLKAANHKIIAESGEAYGSLSNVGQAWRRVADVFEAGSYLTTIDGEAPNHLR